MTRLLFLALALATNAFADDVAKRLEPFRDPDPERLYRGEAVDLAGDGVPEILSAGYLGQNECGVETGPFLAHWNGKRFVDDGRRYVDVLGIYGASTEDEAHGKTLQPGTPFHTEESCYTIELRDGAGKTRALLEELP